MMPVLSWAILLHRCPEPCCSPHPSLRLGILPGRTSFGSLSFLPSSIRFFRHRATALFFLAVFFLLAPANLSDFTSGGDYLTNFFYLVIACAFFIRSLDRPLHVCIPAALFLGVTLSSRIVYAVILIPLLALTLQRTSRYRAIALFVVVLIAAAAVTLPIFAPDTFMHLLQQLLQNAPKLRYIPTALHPGWTLPLLATITACITFLYA